MAARADYDVAIVGARLSGCTAAILLGRAGARVALIEKRPDPQAYKRVCSHFIQASAVPTIERIGLYSAPPEVPGPNSHRPLAPRTPAAPASSPRRRCRRSTCA